MDGASGASSSGPASSAAATSGASDSNGDSSTSSSTSSGMTADASSSSSSISSTGAELSTSSSSAISGPSTGSTLASQPTTADLLSQASTPVSTLAAQPTQAEVLAQGPAPGAVPAATAASDPTADNAVPGPSITGAAQGVAQAGYNTLVDNPKLSVQWESTRSAWTGKVGFTPGLTDVLNQNGLAINPSNMSPAPGSFGKSSGLTFNEANPRNGIAADKAIESRLQSQGYVTDRQVTVQDGRRVDVVGIKTNADPRLNERVEIESKAFRAGVNDRHVSEAVRDGQRLADNVSLRAAGNLLEGVGRVARPVGMVMDAVEVGSAFRADGNRVGENTGRAISGLAGGAAGGWGGAMAGAAIGTAILPGIGTVVGGLIGGIGGAFAGDGIGRSAFNAVRSWF